ncbi:MAG: DUF1992 domain-containing protein [Desulfobulbaceae bacterium]|nr:DUF1992 domain-containing protein [Desulfobulbaceae bacterium]
MIGIIQTIAERKIQQAIEEGALPDLSHWKDKPLPQDDNLARVAPDLRMAYRVLKNAGYIPEELVLHKEILHTRDLLAHAADEQEKLRHLRRISLLRTKMEACLGRNIHLSDESPYFTRVVEQLSKSAR